MRRVLRPSAFSVVFSLVLGLAIAGSNVLPAAATGSYNRSAAHSYADTWSSNVSVLRNPAYNSAGNDNDCQNFTSQVLAAGGYQAHAGFYWDCNGAWWFDGGNYTQSDSWMNNGCFNTFASYHGGDFQYITSQPSTLSEGDFFFMDLDGGTVAPTHSRVIVGMGWAVDSGNWAMLIDQHSNERWHQEWNYLLPGGTPLWSWHVIW
jgi:putative amidase-like protein